MMRFSYRWLFTDILAYFPKNSDVAGVSPHASVAQDDLVGTGEPRPTSLSHIVETARRAVFCFPAVEGLLATVATVQHYFDSSFKPRSTDSVKPCFGCSSVESV